MKDRLLNLLAIFLAAGLAGLATYFTKPNISPPAKTEPSESPASDPTQAICRIIMSNGYCSGTIIDERRPDGTYNIVSAAHCVTKPGEQVRVVLRDGYEIAAFVARIDRKADIAILKTSPLFVRIPYVTLAHHTPDVGTNVLHAGFGTDNPGNIEEGQIASGVDSNGQVRYRLSVSRGDSGGGIVATAKGELLSPVCCTDRVGGLGNVWGGSPEAIRKLLAVQTSVIEETPIEMPSPPRIK